MRLQLLSDLHFEFHRDGGRALVEECHATGVDVLLLAGDIAVAEGIGPALTLFAERYPQVIYVHGNHEFYGSDRARVLAHTRDVCKRLGNVHLLDCESVELGGQRFVGAPLWFARSDAALRYERHLNDFNLIRGYADWVYAEHERARSYFEREARPGDVVITHHLPALPCVLPKYKDDPLNCYFVSDLQHVMREHRPALWVHGHTHGNVDLVCEGTRVRCNPFGYARHEENPEFVERLILEV
jgi:Icc-related predicted phosphoesterase